MSKKINREKSTKKEDIFMDNFNQRDYAQEIIEMAEKIENPEENQFYKGETFKMLKEIENLEYLRKIYNYVIVPYKLEQKEK